MIMYTDKDYIKTKLLKQNKVKMNPDFIELALWIQRKYNSIPLNIYYDLIEDNRPRLSIIFEYQNDELKFRDGFLGNFHSKKQKLISVKFNELVNKNNKYNSENLLVIFTSFEPIAKDEANSLIPESEIKKLQKELAMDNIWTIYRQFSSTTFFFYTDKEIEENSKNGVKEILTDKYFDLLKKHDEFDYFKKETFSIRLDSKENFDKNYNSSWFYYSR